MMTSSIVASQPAPLDIDLARTAILVVDMQNDFGSEGGMFHRAGVDIEPIKAIVPAIAKVLATARSVGLPIVYLKMQYADDLSDLGNPRSANFLKHQRMRVGDDAEAPMAVPAAFLFATPGTRRSSMPSLLSTAISWSASTVTAASSRPISIGN
jgi:ureidoacrylate peracid hydrolase